MRHIIFVLITAAMLYTLVREKDRTVTENGSLGNPKRVIELKDIMINRESVTNTLSIMTHENDTHRHTKSDNDYKSRSDAYDFGWNIGHSTREVIVVVVAIVSVFSLPLVVVFTVFFSRYKDRKVKYRLVEQALANGRPLPEYLFKDTESVDTCSKGIKNVFAGIGLFIFLWAITGEFGLGCIRLLIMFTSSGQVVIYYTQQHKTPQSNGQPDNTKTGFPEENEEE